MGIAGKRILIRADGSHAIGLGHVYRMKALAEGLARRGGRPVFLSLEDAQANPILESSGVPVQTFPPGGLRQAWRWAFASLEPDWILQDILRTDEEEMRFLRSLGDTAVANFDDTGAGLRLADMVINSFAFHWGEYGERDVGSRTRLVEGPRWMILQREIEDWRGTPPRLPDRAERLAVAMGGTDTHRVTGRLLAMLNGLATRSLRIEIVLGPGTREEPGIREEVERSPHAVTVSKAVPSLFRIFRESDLVLCGGGNTLYELAALGVPAMAVACEPHEEKNIRYWEGAGSVLRLGFRTELRPEAGSLVEGLAADPVARGRMSRAGREAMAGAGLEGVLGLLETGLP